MPNTTVSLHSPQMREIYRAIQRVAPTNAPVLITGETGVGKEIIAQAVHKQSTRADKPLKEVNCGTLSRELLSSELFGHEKGAFTGAINQRRGILEQADRGTLFLDEVGDMFPDLQSMFLRVLETQNFTRLGGDRDIRADVRIIAATNSDLETAIDNQRFREDLYYRLSGFQIRIPPLRERPEDIPPLVFAFISEWSAEYEKQVTSITRQALEVLKQAAWPGNIRHLKNVMGRAVLETPTEEAIGVAEISAALSAADESAAAKRLPSQGATRASALESSAARVIEAFYPLLTHLSVTEFVLIFAGIDPQLWKSLPEEVRHPVICEAACLFSKLFGGDQDIIRTAGMTKKEILRQVAQLRIQTDGSIKEAARSLDIDPRTLKAYAEGDKTEK